MIGGTGISILKKKKLTPSFSHHHKDTGFDDYISLILEEIVQAQMFNSLDAEIQKYDYS